MVVLSHSKNIGTNSFGAVKTNIQVCRFWPHLIVCFLHSIGTLPPNEAIDSHCTGEMPNHAEIGYIGTSLCCPPHYSCPYRWWQQAKPCRACEMLIPVLSNTDDEERVLNHCRAITSPPGLLPPTPTSYLGIDHFLISSCSRAVFGANIQECERWYLAGFCRRPYWQIISTICTGKLRHWDLEVQGEVWSTAACVSQITGY